MKNLPELSHKASRFLGVLKMFDGKQVNLQQYAMMLGVSRRRVRMLVSELRHKGYINVIPEHMKIHHSKSCRYIFLDGYESQPEVSVVNSDILRRLGLE